MNLPIINFADSRVFGFNTRYSGAIWRRYNRSFSFTARSCFAVSFFERTGSVLFTDFHARSFIFEFS